MCMTPVSQAPSRFVSASPVEALESALLSGSASDSDAGSSGSVWSGFKLPE